MEITLYKCSICGKMVEVVKDTPAPLVCCGKPMEELIPGTSEGATEKHVPIVEVNETNVTVKVGEVEHPMLEEHYIEWIAICTKNGIYTKSLKPGDKPVATFTINASDPFEAAYGYCNLHGFWKSK